jgi:hypothetical protein
MLKQLHKDRMHAVNNTSPSSQEKTDKALIGSNAMLGKVPYTGGFLDTNKMHEAVNDGVGYLTGSGAGGGSLLKDLTSAGGDALNYLGLGYNK